MKKTTVSFLSQPFVDYQKSCSFLGSCFSENISKKMLEEGFTVHRNPFGVLYNPLSLAKVFTANDEALKASVFERKGVQLSWLANSTCYGKEKAAFQKHVLQIRSDFLKGVEQSSMLILTFGSAFAYKRKESQEIVGNCHKENKDSFTKYLLTVEEMYDVWIKILKSDLLSSRKVILTVSPVRHVKDELIQNTISKARLIELVHRLEKDVEHVFYFPSYEILLDELRDYAYFGRDGVHPNELAVDYIWEKFKSAYFTEETLKINQEFLQIQQLFRHKPLHEFSEETRDFIKKREAMKEEFLQKYPYFKTTNFLK